MKIFEGGGESFEVTFQKVSQTRFDARGLAQRVAHGAIFSQLWRHRVAVLVILYQRLHFGIASGFDALRQVAHAVAIHAVSELHLGAHFVALSDGDLPHIVAEPAEPCALPIMPSGGCPAPRAQLLLDGSILPKTRDDLPIQAHAAHDESVLAVAMSGL